jgi:hypothetical protein
MSFTKFAVATLCLTFPLATYGYTRVSAPAGEQRPAASQSTPAAPAFARSDADDKAGLERALSEATGRPVSVEIANVDSARIDRCVHNRGIGNECAISAHDRADLEAALSEATGSPVTIE